MGKAWVNLRRNFIFIFYMVEGREKEDIVWYPFVEEEGNSFSSSFSLCIGSRRERRYRYSSSFLLYVTFFFTIYILKQEVGRGRYII